MFNIVEARNMAWEQGYYRYEWDNVDRGGGMVYPDNDQPQPPTKLTARIADCEFCGVKGAQQSLVRENWLCHGCQTRADIARDAQAELAAGKVLHGTYLNQLRLQGRL